MHLNRIARILSEASTSTLVAPLPASRSLTGFAVCPACLVQGPWQQQIYQAAYERAQASVSDDFLRRVYAVSVN